MIYVMAAVGTLLVYLERRGTVLEAGITIRKLLQQPRQEMVVTYTSLVAVKMVRSGWILYV